MTEAAAKKMAADKTVQSPTNVTYEAVRTPGAPEAPVTPWFVRRVRKNS